MAARAKLLILAAVVVLAATACMGPATTPSPSPVPTASTTPSTTAPPTETPSTGPATPSPTTTETMIVRAYFFLDDAAGGDPALVPVLRTVPRTAATAHAAMTQLLAGPVAGERTADPGISTLIPAGTELLGVSIADGVARVDLSGEFGTGGGTFAARGRLAQVVYTLTQFPSVDAVTFLLDGERVTVMPPEGIPVGEPSSRADFRDELLPAIFVDRPAWGASLLPPGRVTGLANVFEAQFRIALVAANGKVLVDRPVLATCGSGCWGRFDVTLDYAVTKGQWGTLRVWDPSERDGEAEFVREYPIWLVPEG